MSARQEITKLISRARHVGLVIVRTQGGHLRVVDRDGAVTTIGGTPGRATVSWLLRKISAHEQHRRHER
jgi:predicted RNA binding protein YcfA (HicA-like mRNA interferase family)